jgi:hypothetical protein
MFSIRTFPTIILFNQKTRKYRFIVGYSKQTIDKIKEEFLILAK